ncbi:3-mercaptopyruvate sulfurtransferase [Ventosimonas gracilis]|uniref:3-mercaptopyruvate sulfurtransferase n=1 Tax=Ventosimonas gracilis TaxID=1680762 RepID=A0A139SYB1_9GAMM|nr:3-mercaptopyruvate sulfurtransferase [Ventosimonas gracilis]KXU39464.1 3-mercaptopyruvate sulfurtransferase [Ventosimonas gracilis]
MSLPDLIDCDWLAAHLAEPDLLVFDASFYLPDEGRDARGGFLSTHIPGARFFDIEVFSDTDTDLAHMAPSAGRFARLAGELGISNTSRVVVYDQKGLFSAARVWWLLRLFGHEQVAVLDGGLPLWSAGGRKIVSGASIPAPKVSFLPKLNARLLRGLGDIEVNLHSKAALVLDARSAERFAGEAAEPRPGLASGHIPGSRNLHYTKLLDENACFKSAEELRSLFIALGVEQTRPVITSCGSGITAAILNLGLHLAGFEMGALYDGSWAEWGSREDMPKEQGA